MLNKEKIKQLQLQECVGKLKQRTLLHGFVITAILSSNWQSWKRNDALSTENVANEICFVVYIKFCMDHCLISISPGSSYRFCVFGMLFCSYFARKIFLWSSVFRILFFRNIWLLFLQFLCLVASFWSRRSNNIPKAQELNLSIFFSGDERSSVNISKHKYLKKKVCGEMEVKRRS